MSINKKWYYTKVYTKYEKYTPVGNENSNTMKTPKTPKKGWHHKKFILLVEWDKFFGFHFPNGNTCSQVYWPSLMGGKKYVQIIEKI